MVMLVFWGGTATNTRKIGHCCPPKLGNSRRVFQSPFFQQTVRFKPKTSSFCLNSWSMSWERTTLQESKNVLNPIQRIYIYIYAHPPHDPPQWWSIIIFANFDYIQIGSLSLFPRGFQEGSFVSIFFNRNSILDSTVATACPKSSWA